MSGIVSVPRGTRDYDPLEMGRRKYLMRVLEKHFRRFCFLPIETPSFEKLSILEGKYGEEGDRLMFKILNSGEYLRGVSQEDFQDKNYNTVTNAISEKALRYDLTVPFARYVVQHQSKIVYPFKRYQMQPVWRGDRPQKGRFREFYQCDADVVGTSSLWQEIDLIQLYDSVLSELGIEASIKINHRKILLGMAQAVGQEDNILDITMAVDKLDKIGRQGVQGEMLSKGIPAEAVKKLISFLDVKGDNVSKLHKLNELLSNSGQGAEGLKELEFILSNIEELKLGKTSLALEVTLARGLNYYTGAIFEVQARGIDLGSIGGGGRYDDLTGIFGLKGVSGVGISFGLDRIYLVMQELGLFETVDRRTEVLFVNFGEDCTGYVVSIVNELRRAGICAEMYPEPAKVKKQMTYANKRGISFVAMIGSNEYKSKQITLRDMITGEQETMQKQKLVEYILGK